MWFCKMHFLEAQTRHQDKSGMHIYIVYTRYEMQEVLIKIQYILRSFHILFTILDTDNTKLHLFAIVFSTLGNGSPYTLWAHIEALEWLLCEDGIDNKSVKRHISYSIWYRRHEEGGQIHPGYKGRPHSPYIFSHSHSHQRPSMS